MMWVMIKSRHVCNRWGLCNLEIPCCFRSSHLLQGQLPDWCRKKRKRVTPCVHHKGVDMLWLKAEGNPSHCCMMCVRVMYHNMGAGVLIKQRPVSRREIVLKQRVPPKSQTPHLLTSCGKWKRLWRDTISPLVEQGAYIRTKGQTLRCIDSRL